MFSIDTALRISVCIDLSTYLFTMPSVHQWILWVQWDLWLTDTLVKCFRVWEKLLGTVAFWIVTVPGIARWPHEVAQKWKYGLSLNKYIRHTYCMSWCSLEFNFYWSKMTVCCSYEPQPRTLFFCFYKNCRIWISVRLKTPFPCGTKCERPADAVL